MMHPDTKNLIIVLKRTLKFLLKMLEKLEKGEDILR